MVTLPAARPLGARHSISTASFPATGLTVVIVQGTATPST